jgi:hypothetical protein
MSVLLAWRCGVSNRSGSTFDSVASTFDCDANVTCAIGHATVATKDEIGKNRNDDDKRTNDDAHTSAAGCGRGSGCVTFGYCVVRV